MPPKTEIRQILQARLDALEAADAQGRGGQAIVTLDQQSVGRLSRQDALLGQSMARAGQTRRDRERARLLDALHRLDTDPHFGTCADCGEEIAPRRLAVDPATRLCIDCARG